MALKRDVPSHLDYVLVNVGGKEVIVQNFNGSISAFTNVCPHRGSAIHTEPRGNRRLICPYHIWSFNSEGVLQNAPLSDSFSEVDLKNRARTSLDAWSVETCGDLIFVARPNGRDLKALREALGAELFNYLEAMSNQFGEEILTFDTDIDANWKLIMQNTVEFYHVYSVHPQTFAPISAKPPRLTDYCAPKPHLWYVAQLQSLENQPRLWLKYATLFAKNPTRRGEGYNHVLLFPAVTFGSVDGQAVSIFQYIPASPVKTRLRIRSFYPALANMSALDSMALATIKPALIDLILQISNEDRQICESTQRRLRNARSEIRPIFGAQEELVERLQRYYLDELSSHSS